MTYMPESRTQAKKSVEPVYMESIALVDRITLLSKQHLEMLIDRLGGCAVQALAKRDEGRAHLLHAMRAVVENYLEFCSWEVLDALRDDAQPGPAVSAPPTRRVRWPEGGEEHD